jgi:hypothetical protein
MSDLDFATTFEFDLPRGFVDKEGVLHKHGVMRLATAADEIVPLRDQRVLQNPGYLTVILLARVITELGTLPKIDVRVIENLYSADLAYLQNMYQIVNAVEEPVTSCVCPECGTKFEQPINFTRAE